MKAEEGFKRRDWRVINRNIQIRFALVVAWLLIVLCLVTGLFIYFTIRQYLAALPHMTHPEHIAVVQQRISKLLAAEFLLGGGFVLILGTILVFRILHHLSGPLTRLRNALQQVADGKLPERPVVFRRGDFYHGLAEAFNQLVSSLKSRREI